LKFEKVKKRGGIKATQNKMVKKKEKKKRKRNNTISSDMKKKKEKDRERVGKSVGKDLLFFYARRTLIT
jgi:hypothetical protein